MNYNTYEVLLGRDNGYNKTVHVHDCMYEDEARLLAESQYGLPVLRVLYQGKSSYGGQSSYDLEPPYQQYRNVFANIGQEPGIFVGLVLIILMVEFWYVFVVAGAAGIGLQTYKYFKDED